MQLGSPGSDAICIENQEALVSEYGDYSFSYFFTFYRLYSRNYCLALKGGFTMKEKFFSFVAGIREYVKGIAADVYEIREEMFEKNPF